MAPSKHIPVILEKSYQCLADHWASEGTNPRCPIIPEVVKKYLFKPFNGLCHHSMLFYVHGLKVVVHLHHSYIAFMRSYLMFLQLPYSIICRELDH